MSLLKRLLDKKTQLTSYFGGTPNSVVDPKSKLHYSYSIDGKPSLKGKPSPSKLDLDPKSIKRYMDNLPK